MKGEPLELGGEKIYFAPMECGPAGDEKQAALNAIINMDTADWGCVRTNVGNLAMAMLKQNYGVEKARAIIDEHIHVGHMSALISICQWGTLPENFTTDGLTRLRPDDLSMSASVESTTGKSPTVMDSPMPSSTTARSL